MKNITIIGGGNLGVSIAQGLINADFTPAQNICITRRNIDALAHLAQKNVVITPDNVLAIRHADCIILAVKPAEIRAVLHEIKNNIEPNQIVVSVATGVSIADIEGILGNKMPIFRAMPNTAIAIQESMTCIAPNAQATPTQVQAVQNMFEQLGIAIVIPENLMEAATVLAACGIAYAMRFIRAASQGGIEIGFEAELALKIAAQTVRGAASLLLQNHSHPEREIDKVTTPQGCTIAGLNEMEHQGFSSALIKGVQTSYKKIAKIKEDF
jgi:pyrroline-5-carboxylate reductase